MSDRDYDDYEEFQEYKKYKNSKKKKVGLLGFASRKFFVIAAIVVVLLIIAMISFLAIQAYKKYEAFKNPEPEITSSMLVSRIEDESDLTTAELSYRGMIHYEEGDIPFINKKSYNMVYSATVDAGVDLSLVEIDVTDTQVVVTLPEVEVKDPVVDVNTIEFYDESSSLFNWDSKTDGVEAVGLAEADCLANADIEQLKTKAGENAEKVVTDLIDDLIGDRQLVFD